MSERISTRQEQFIQNYLFGNMSAVDAYIQAGYTAGKSSKPYSAVTRLLTKPHIRERIAQLNNDSVIASAYTREYLAVRLHDVYERALKEGKLDSGIRALVEISRLAGYHIDRIDVSIDTSKDERLSEISTADIAKFIIENRKE
jgi:phage terminase small subunit